MADTATLSEPETRLDLTPSTPMSEVLRAFPGAKRALFARYHIGGCSSCAYAGTETIAEVCARNENLPIAEVIAHIHSAHEHDLGMMIEPADLAASLASESPPRLLDLRTREEFEAVSLPGAELFSQDLSNALFASEAKDRAIVLYDHTGDRVLDTTAFLIGHGFARAKALRGGIDAYAREVDPGIARYRLEFEESSDHE
jgi:rhodanese-related sulfurtransferase